jgi:hypothetical protein
MGTTSGICGREQETANIRVGMESAENGAKSPSTKRQATNEAAEAVAAKQLENRGVADIKIGGAATLENGGVAELFGPGHVLKTGPGDVLRAANRAGHADVATQ